MNHSLGAGRRAREAGPGGKSLSLSACVSLTHNSVTVTLERAGLITLVMATPLGWLAHERMARGRSIDAQATYILVGKRIYYSRNKIAYMDRTYGNRD